MFIASYIRETARDSLIDAFKTQDKLDVLRIHYENKLAESKDNPVLLTIMARIYWEEKDYQKSAEMFEALGRLNPINVHYLYYAAAALQKSHQPELTEEMLNQAKIALAGQSRREMTCNFLVRLQQSVLKTGCMKPRLNSQKPRSV